MANKRQNRKTGKFIRNVVRNEEAKEYAADYYDKHQKSIDRLLNGRTTRNNKEVFIDLVDDLFQQNGVKYNSKKNLRSIIDELKGIDPRLNEIKRTAENREEAGFKDLRKLNKRVSYQEISYSGPDNIVGYYDIKDSDYVIVHKLDYTYSSKSPTNLYEYMTRINAGLI